MVRGVPNISVPTPSYTLAQGGKISLPVDSYSLIYSHFKHVSGILAKEGTQGVAISKLNLLDVLIGQLDRIKKAPGAQSPLNSFEGVDALIESIENQIRQAKAASSTIPYSPPQIGQSGAVFSLSI
jgi:hypothetical protein